MSSKPRFRSEEDTRDCCRVYAINARCHSAPSSQPKTP